MIESFWHFFRLHVTLVVLGLWVVLIVVGLIFKRRWATTEVKLSHRSSDISVSLSKSDREWKERPRNRRGPHGPGGGPDD